MAKKVRAGSRGKAKRPRKKQSASALFKHPSGHNKYARRFRRKQGWSRASVRRARKKGNI